MTLIDNVKTAIMINIGTGHARLLLSLIFQSSSKRNACTVYVYDESKGRGGVDRSYSITTLKLISISKHLYYLPLQHRGSGEGSALFLMGAMCAINDDNQSVHSLNARFQPCRSS